EGDVGRDRRVVVDGREGGERGEDAAAGRLGVEDAGAADVGASLGEVAHDLALADGQVAARLIRDAAAEAVAQVERAGAAADVAAARGGVAGDFRVRDGCDAAEIGDGAARADADEAGVQG